MLHVAGMEWDFAGVSGVCFSVGCAIVIYVK